VFLLQAELVKRKALSRELWAVPLVCFFAEERQSARPSKKSVKSHACITSRLRRVCHRERGRSVRVINSPSNWGGVENTSIGASETVNAESPARSKEKKVKMN